MSHEMQYTVILLRPDYVSDPSCPADTYMAHVWAESVNEAIDKAQIEAHAADHDPDDGGDPIDYFPMFVFEGHLVSVGGY